MCNELPSARRGCLERMVGDDVDEELDRADGEEGRGHHRHKGTSEYPGIRGWYRWARATPHRYRLRVVDSSPEALRG